MHAWGYVAASATAEQDHGLPGGLPRESPPTTRKFSPGWSRPVESHDGRVGFGPAVADAVALVRAAA